MENIRLSLFDNDFQVRAKENIVLLGDDDPLSKFLHEMKEKLLPGETAHLEIEGFEKETVVFDIANSKEFPAA